jgi:hypothetical protein
MELPTGSIGILLGILMLAGLNNVSASDLYEVDIEKLAEIWESEHISSPDPRTLKHAELSERLQALVEKHSHVARMEEVGRSVEGRELFLMSLGTGSENILLWSQMHGDEPTATSSLLDIIDFIGKRSQEPWIADVLDKYTLLMIPMLNPDGAERFQRRNAQDIDINRDARDLVTPEGQTLKAIRDRYEPFLGFNLHNQGTMTTVGDTGKVATIALLAVATDVPGVTPRPAIPDPTIPLSKQVTAVLYEALSPFIYGHVSRYDETFNPRAFGDNVTLWGTPVVLIESGGDPTGSPLNFGVKLNFVGILAVLNSLATGKIANANPAVFDALKMNSESPIYSMILKNAWIFNGTNIPLFKGDIAIRHDSRDDSNQRFIIGDIGDLEVYSAHHTIDCAGALITPGLIAWDPGQPMGSKNRNDREYLERGITTILETSEWKAIANQEPQPEKWNEQKRGTNWGFIISGDPPSDPEQAKLQLAKWLAAGGRGVVVPFSNVAEAEEVANWFDLDAIPPEDGGKFQLLDRWVGDPVGTLPRWTSEAASQFKLSQRGTITRGATADLVIWANSADERVPTEMGHLKPRQVIVNGQVIDLSDEDHGSHGRFVGSN